VGLEKAMNSENYKFAKELLAYGSLPPPLGTPLKNIPCLGCATYKSMLKSKRFLSGRYGKGKQK